MSLPGKAALAVLAAGTLTAAGVLFATQSEAAAASCGAFYDDFSYNSRTDAAFTGNGWVARGEAGGPGVRVPAGRPTTSPSRPSTGRRSPS